MSSSFEDSGENHGSPHISIEYLYNIYYSRLCFYAYKIVGDQSVSKDIVQDAFVKYWNARNHFETESSIKNFLYISIRNACLNHVRHDEVAKRYAENQDPDPFAAEIGLDHIIRAEVLGEIKQAMDALPEGCRSVLQLAFFEGLKNDEIAQKLGISVNTVKSQRQRALQLLRMKLDFKAFLVILAILHP